MNPEQSAPAALIAILEANDPSFETKARACRQLALTGDAAAVPVLAGLLADEKLGDYARNALETLPCPEAGAALRNALPRLKGRQMAGVVDSLGMRRDPAAVADLAAMANDPAAALEAGVPGALAKIGTDEAVAALKRILASPHAGLRMASVHAALAAARDLLASGRGSHAAELLAALPGNGLPAYLTAAAEGLRERARFVPLFDGKTLTGWEGDPQWFAVRDGAIIAGSLDRAIPHNEFLCTAGEYGDFELRLQVRLTAAQGNGGIQFRSKRVPNSSEVSGYQADAAAGYWGGIYDESRRAKFLGERVGPEALAKVLNPGDWNDYRIRCEGPRVRLWLNGLLTTDYTETDANIPRTGRIAVQIHAGPPTEASYRRIGIEVL